MQLNPALGRLPKRGIATLGLFAITACTALSLNPNLPAAAQAFKQPVSIQSVAGQEATIDSDVVAPAADAPLELPATTSAPSAPESEAASPLVMQDLNKVETVSPETTAALTAQAPPAQAPVTQAVVADPALLVQSGLTQWRYLDTDVDPNAGLPTGATWTAPNFDDSLWSQAKGTFAAKRSGTEVSAQYSSSILGDNLLNYFGQDAVSVTRTHFFRATVDLSAEQIAQGDFFVGKTLSDDGIVIYINGTEVARNDVPVGTQTLAYASGGSTGLDEVDFTVAKNKLVPGQNTIAVAVHQDRASSSDIFFDFVSLAPGHEVEEVPAPPSRLVLTPTDSPENSQSFTWLAASPDAATGVVEIKPAAGGTVRTVKAYSQGTYLSTTIPHFSATATGLKAATKYSYRVGNGQSFSEWHEFTTANPNATDFTYLYYGDAQIGLDTTWPEVVRQAEAKAPHSIGSVHAGDLIDTGSNDTQWKNWFKGMETSAATTNVMAAPGNHEYSGDKLMEAWKAHFEYPLNQPNTSTIGDLALKAQGTTDAAKQYAAYFEHWSKFAAETVYFTDYQGVRFITVNATRDTTFLKPDNLPACTSTEEVPCPSQNVAALWTEFQAEWLDHVLEESDQKWNVVTFHQPVYSTSAGRDEKVLRDLWVPIFEKHNIDLVQMGHDHTYARGYNNADATETAGITTGPVYVVSNSGAKHYNLETDEKNVWTNNGATQVKRAQGLTTYQVIDVTANTMTYRSYIAEVNDNYNSVPGAAVGQVYDEFTITKSDAGVKYVTEAGLAAPTEPEEPGTDEPGTDEPGTDEPGDGTDEPDTDKPGAGTGIDKPGMGTDDNKTNTDNTDSGSKDDSKKDEEAVAGDKGLAGTGASGVIVWIAVALALLAGAAGLFTLRRKMREDM